MNKIILANLFLNLILALIFVLLNRFALENGFEETFIFLALFYGLITTLANVFFVIKLIKK